MKGPPTKPTGRRTPPREGLVGRSEACRILGCDSRQFRRFVEEGVVPLAAVDKDPDGRVQARWFDLNALRELAARMRRWKKRAERLRRRQKAPAAKNAAPHEPGASQPAKPALRDDYRPEREEYRPELRLRGAPSPRGAAQASPPSSATPAKPRDAHGEERRRLDGTLLTRPLTQVPANWLTDPLPK